MPDTRKPKQKPAPTGKSQPGRDGRGSGTAAKSRQPDKGKLARGRRPGGWRRRSAASGPCSGAAWPLARWSRCSR